MTTFEPAEAAQQDIVSVLVAIAGADAVLTEIAERTFFSTDISKRGETAEAVVRVRDTATLTRIVAACTQRDRVVIPRGGGFSYTGGYTPARDRTVVVDLRPMNQINEINTRDMYVVVETGCTWERLYEALRARGVRTPYFGPMSGFRATIGGALSQGSFFLGSSQYGTVSDSVLGLEIVLADGTILRTGAWGSAEGTPPFVRQYGPDATGLFLNDTGAMGLKTRAALRLIPFPEHQAYGSFAFTSHAQALACVSDIGRSGLAAECYCWDPYFVTLMAAASTGTKQDLRYLLNVVRAGSGLVDGLGGAARIALAGRRVFSGDTWLVHVAIDDVSTAGAAAKLKLIRAMARAAGGCEVAPSAPRTLRGTPFTDFNVPERRTHIRNLPIHGLVPHSAAPALADKVYGFLAEHKTDLLQHDIRCGVIFFAVAAQAVCIEPLLYWQDEEHFLHNRIEETSDMDALASHAERPAATQAAYALCDGLKAIFRRHGSIHMQIGRAYPWAETREPANLALLTAIKNTVDPQRLINRGALGWGSNG